MTIKTFRGILTDTRQDTIRLSTKQGKIGYKIVRFDIIPQAPITSDIEAVMKIYKVSQENYTNTVDFSDGNLLGCAVWWGGAAGVSNPQDWIQIFDEEIFNQDIYITAVFSGGSFECNYYLELEVMNLNDNETAVSTLMDIRATAEAPDEP